MWYGFLVPSNKVVFKLYNRCHQPGLLTCSMDSLAQVNKGPLNLSVLEEATTMSLLWSSMHDGDGALMFCKTYWKQRVTYEIKLHGGQDDIHDDICHWYVLSCRSDHFFVGLKDRGTDFVLIKWPWPLHTRGLVDIFLQPLTSEHSSTTATRPLQKGWPLLRSFTVHIIKIDLVSVTERQ